MVNKIFEIKNMVGKKNTFYLCLLFFFLIISSITEFIGLGSIPIYIGLITDTDYYLGKINSDFINKKIEGYEQSQLIIISSIALVIIFFAKNIFQIFLVYFQGKLIKKIKLNLTTKIFNEFLNIEFKEILKRNTSIFIRTINLDAGNTTIFILNILNLVKETLTIIAIIILLLIAKPYISLILFVFFSISVALFYLFTHKKLFERGKKIQFLHSEIIKLVTETMGSIKEIKVFNQENKISKIFSKAITSSEEFLFKNYVIKSLPRIYLELLCVIVIVLVILSFVLLNEDIISLLPFLSLIVVSALRLIPGLNLIQNSISTLKSIMPSYNHIINEIDFLQKQNQNKKNNMEPVYFKKEILLKNISFKYDNFPKMVLDNLDFQINKGDRIGIIGGSGTGKTTLVNLILGLIKPTSGGIFIDGNKYDASKNSWGNNLGYVPQETFLIDDTIKKNILFGLEENDNTLDELLSAASKAQILEFINSLSDKFDTKVGERGVNLSIGQKQRIGIARALYRNPDLLVFDESTSSLDQTTETNFVNDIFKITEDKTIIFISHRLNALRNCNKIFDIGLKKIVNL